ncbi:PilW family protein [Luteimonas sp. MJ246]|uniref:PilW family protein n=1 Tax=Luteimonas sp. MJ174 TaxID=3129237 RepID=UPI0031BA5C80
MNRSRPQAGVTLIELMIALGIGALLILGLVQVFSASRTAYQLSTGLARSQENGRFAIDILQREVRMAGHAGCVNDQARFLPENITPSRPALVSTFLSDSDQLNGNYAPDYLHDALRFDKAIEAYEGNAAGATSYTMPGTAVAAESAGEWRPALPAGLFTALNDPLPGSDILILRGFTPTGAQITNFAAGNPATITFETTHAKRLTEGVANPKLFGIADCMGAAVFKGDYADINVGQITVTDVNGNVTPLATLPIAPGQAMLYRADSLVYYVGLNAQDVPSLYRLRYTMDNAGDVVAFNEELVEGIELMQLRFGQDSFTGAGDRPTGNIGSATTADAVVGPSNEEAWRRVGLVQIGLVARSAEPAAARQRNVSEVTPPLSTLGLAVTPPADTFYRTVYEDSIALRNRLFGN